MCVFLPKIQFWFLFKVTHNTVYKEYQTKKPELNVMVKSAGNGLIWMCEEKVNRRVTPFVANYVPVFSTLVHDFYASISNKLSCIFKLEVWISTYNVFVFGFCNKTYFILTNQYKRVKDINIKIFVHSKYCATCCQF